MTLDKVLELTDAYNAWQDTVIGQEIERIPSEIADRAIEALVELRIRVQMLNECESS